MKYRAVLLQHSNDPVMKDGRVVQQFSNEAPTLQEWADKMFVEFPNSKVHVYETKEVLATVYTKQRSKRWIAVLGTEADFWTWIDIRAIGEADVDRVKHQVLIDNELYCHVNDMESAVGVEWDRAIALRSANSELLEAIKPLIGRRKHA
jgi:hypothetical protein